MIERDKKIMEYMGEPENLIVTAVQEWMVSKRKTVIHYKQKIINYKKN